MENKTNLIHQLETLIDQHGMARVEYVLKFIKDYPLAPPYNNEGRWIQADGVRWFASSMQMTRINEYLRNGYKIQAIKYLREEFQKEFNKDVGLYTAKDMIESLM